jgi:hypothetical protein
MLTGNANRNDAFDVRRSKGGATMDPKQFAELHAKCWETLKHYVHEADRMCELFGQCLPEPSSIQIRLEIIQQRNLENNAYARYIEIRRQLFEAARIGYDASN